MAWPSRWRRQRLRLIDEAAFSSVDNGLNDTILAAINAAASWETVMLSLGLEANPTAARHGKYCMMRL